jgi:hypothetical protein
MKVKRLKKILLNLNDNAEIYIESFCEGKIKYDIEYIKKEESVYTLGYGKSRILRILLKEKRK